MSTTMDANIKRWTEKRKMALVIEVMQGKTTVSEASRSYDLTSLEVEASVEDANKGMENSLRSKSGPRFFSDQTTVWFLQVGTSPLWFETTA